MLGLTKKGIMNPFCSRSLRCLIIVLILAVNLSYAQSPGLNEYKLLKLQSSSLNEIETFLKSEKWGINRASENQSNYYFGYNLDYNVTTFIKSDVDQLMVYHYPNKKNILIYQLSADSFNTFLNQMNSSKGGGKHKSYKKPLCGIQENPAF